MVAQQSGAWSSVASTRLAPRDVLAYRTAADDREGEAGEDLDPVGLAEAADREQDQRRQRHLRAEVGEQPRERRQHEPEKRPAR